MNRLVIDLEALRHNVATIDAWMRAAGARWTLVTKVLCGEPTILRALAAMGVRSVGESRLANLDDVTTAMPRAEIWYLRPTHPSAVAAVVAHCGVSLNSEIETLRLIDAEAGRRGVLHRALAMVELGDLREGMLPVHLPAFCEAAQRLRHVRLVGLGANLGCLAGVLPTSEHFAQLALYRELIELKLGCRLPIVSAGTSVALPQLRAGRVPLGINHYRIGEAVFLGTDLVSGGTIPGLRDDVVILRAEVAELKRKALAPSGELGADAHVLADPARGRLGERGWRALISIGQYDAECGGLLPLDARHVVAGASSDLTVLNLGDDAGGLRVGDDVGFRLRYAALLRLMGSRYVAKVVQGAAAPALELAQERLGRRRPGRGAEIISMPRRDATPAAHGGMA